MTQIIFVSSDKKSPDTRELYLSNKELPRFRQKRTSTVEWRVFRGRGAIQQQVGVLINLATCPTPELRLSARELLRDFEMLLQMEKVI